MKNEKTRAKTALARNAAPFVAVICVILSFTQPVWADKAAPPPVFCLNPEALARTKARVGDKAGAWPLQPALDRLIAEAEGALKARPESVMDKTKVPPSGDKHDFISLAPYFWPNPATKDGLPYVRHDGKHNPDADNPSNTDAPHFSHIMATVETLSLAYYFTGRDAYAAHAAELLRVWFVDPATRMNPNLNYGQAILGVNDGRGTGIIGTAILSGVVDSAGLLETSSSWTAADRKGLTDWMRDYLAWLQTSKNGRDEAKATNNHGTYYDIQIVSLALYTGQKELARKTLETAKTRRIAVQIEPDGRMPLELARANSISYCTYNLAALEKLANLGDRVGVDLWGFQTPDGRGIRQAVAYLAPYADPAKPWPLKLTGADKRGGLTPLLAEADHHYHTAWAGKTPGNRAERFHLLVAAP